MKNHNFLISFLYLLFFSVHLFSLSKDLLTCVRPMGMGGAFCGIADDYNAVVWNPAGLDILNRAEIGISYVKHFVDIYQLASGFVLPTLTSGGFGIWFHYLDYGMFDYRNSIGEKTGNFTRKDTTSVVSYGRKLYEYGDRYLSLGGSVKYMHVNLRNIAEGSALSYDLGILWQVNKAISFGYVFRNLLNISNDTTGVKQKFENFSFRIGSGIKPIRFLKLACDIEGEKDNILSLYSVGVELAISNFYLRAGGMWYSKSIPQISYGFGLKSRKLMLNYAFLNHNELGYNHRIAVSLYFSKDSLLKLEKLEYEMIGANEFKIWEKADAE